MTRTLTLFGLALVLAACGGKDEAAKSTASKDGKADDKASIEGVASTPTKKYNVKSGILEMKVDFIGDQKATVYFDDYGAKEATYTTTEMMGQKIENVQINVDGWNYTFTPSEKKGTKTKMSASLSALGGVPNLSDLSDKMKESFKYKEIAGQTILGKDAKGIGLEIMGSPMRVWQWEGIPLRTEMDMKNGQNVMKMVVEATSLKTDVEVPGEKFQVPSDVVFTETGTTQPGGM